MSHDLFGVRVIVDPFVPPNEFYAFGDLEKPDGWEAMTPAEKFRYAVSRGAVVHVHDLADFRESPDGS